MITNIAGYKFVHLQDLTTLKTNLMAQCHALEIKGTILLSQEGINLTLAGKDEAIQGIIKYIKTLSPFSNLRYKYSYSEQQPFKRMWIKLKKEIITMGVPMIDPAKCPAPEVSPREFKRWLDERKDIVVIDTRNDYEYQQGSFKNAINLHIEHFSEFPAAIADLDADLKNKPVVVFCTGGIRCEKAAPYMQQQGFQEVYQLEGGILTYFEECGGAHYEGNCFVFDDRVALDPNLETTGATICKLCHHIGTQHAPHECVTTI